MEYNAKTIQIFLPDGDPKGIKIAEITSRIVKAIFVPRSELENAIKREEFHNVGVYFLFGKNEAEAKPRVYIGETEEAVARMKSHDKEKEFWEHLIFVTTSNNRLTKADLMDIFGTMKILLTTLGYSIFEEYEQPKEFFICKGRGVVAKGAHTDDGFVVYSGSEMALEPVPSLEKGYVDLRNKLIKNKVVERKDAKYIFKSNHVFSVPSPASSCVLGRPSNGWVDWKDENGKTLKELKED